MRTGVITYWNRERFFGFLRLNDAPESIFFHGSDVQGVQDLKRGDAVACEVFNGRKGLEARNVRLASAEVEQ